MGVYNEFTDAYVIESHDATGTYGTSTITGAGDTTYKLGAIDAESHLPSPQTLIHYMPTAVNAKEVADGKLFKGKFIVDGMYGLIAQNGIPIWLAMGNSSTAGAGPYTHTITPYTDGTLLPSITFQHERAGDGTDWNSQAVGVKVRRMTIAHDFNKAPFLMYRLDVVGKQVADPGFTLTNKPALPATANSDEYVALTRTFNSVDIAALHSLEFIVDNGLTPVHTHTYSGATYTGRWPSYYREATRKSYNLKLRFHPDTIESAIWDEILETDPANAKTVVLKWTRSTNDYIQITMTDCEVTQYPLRTPLPGDVLVDECIIEPRAISFEVKDSIAGGAYGD